MKRQKRQAAQLSSFVIHVSPPLHTAAAFKDTSGLICLYFLVLSFSVSSDCFYMNMPRFKMFFKFSLASLRLLHCCSSQTAKKRRFSLVGKTILSALNGKCPFLELFWSVINGFIFSYLHNLDECFQLVHVKLQVQSVCQPNTHCLHGAGVPLL